MGIFDGAILLSDIDGTLLESGIIPERNIHSRHSADTIPPRATL